jgi:hypothetical protein
MNDEVLNPNTQSIIKAAIFEWLARLVADKKYEVNLNQAAHQALDTLYRKGMLPSQAPSNIRFEELYTHRVSSDIINSVTQIFWELHLQGVLIPSPAWISSKTGFALITPYGQEIISENSGRIQTYDSAGYLDNFIKETPAPDTEMLRYVKESISVFQHGHFFACVILLGVASERLITVLAEKLRDSLGNPNGNEWFQKKFRGDASEKFKAINNQLLAEYGEELEREKLKDALQGIVKLTFETIRHARNEIAHPKGREFTWNEVSGLLHNFVQYFKYTNKIIMILINNPKNRL